MNILIDAIAITKTKAGVGVYAKNLIEEILKLDSRDKFFILTQDDDPDFHFDSSANVKVLKVRSKLFRAVPLRFLFEQFFLPVLLRKYKIDVLHSLHYSFPLVHFGSRQVVTLHDMTSFTMPELHLSSKAIYYRFFTRAAVRFADAVIFVSKSTRDDCARLLGEPKGEAAVIYLATSPIFRPDFEPFEIQSRLVRYNLPSDYLLYVGMIEPRKNLPRLVKAFARIAPDYPNLKLVIVGKKGWMYHDLFQQIESLNLESRIIFTGFVPEDDKPYLIAGANVFVYPSLYEGFGIPVLEALSCGTPTITSNVSSIPEVAGDAALLIQPTDEAELATALTKLLSDEKLRQHLRREGILQAQRFNWNATASQTLQVYQRVRHRN